eukprot:GHVH01001695.1.p2 GENE.GHVH01001695.1~~GHVH01001695.1.p2  ORF type:complete len:233 (-),score=46.33 GHVH01001695.1:62-760(-)
MRANRDEEVKARKVATLEAKQKEIARRQAAQLAGIKLDNAPLDVTNKVLTTGASQSGATIPWFKSKSSVSSVKTSTVGGSNDVESGVNSKKRNAVSFSFGRSGAKTAQQVKKNTPDMMSAFDNKGITVESTDRTPSPAKVLTFDDLLSQSNNTKEEVENTVKVESSTAEAEVVDTSGDDCSLGLFMSALGRKVQVSEIIDSTSELESKMTDDEYEEYSAILERYEEMQRKRL